MGYGWNAQLSCFPCIPHMRCAMHGHKRSSEPSRISHPPLHPLTMALPYDATPPPDAAPSLASHSPPRAPSPLDRALDDFPPPAHVQSLVSRMSAAKVYLVDESPAVLHLDGHARLREPPLRRLAHQLDRMRDDGVHAWLDGVGAAHSVAVKPNAVYLSSELIQHLSTAKVFSWATGLGAEPMGASVSAYSEHLLIYTHRHRVDQRHHPSHPLSLSPAVRPRTRPPLQNRLRSRQRT